jgi:hypothetical protein
LPARRHRPTGRIGQRQLVGTGRVWRLRCCPPRHDVSQTRRPGPGRGRRRA